MGEPDKMGDLIEENRRLRERIFELEEQLGKDRGQLERETTHVSRVVKLLRQKDQTLEEYAFELEQKREELEDLVRSLEKKNQQLQVWVAALKLHQDIIENESAAVVGLNKEGRIVLFNKAALSAFGDELHGLIGQGLVAVDFSGFDPETPRLVREVMKSQNPMEKRADIDNRVVQTSIYPMGKGRDFRGVLVKMSVQG